MTQQEINAAIADPTDENLIALYRHALAMGWAGTSRSINGRSIAFASPGDLLDLIERLEGRIENDDDDESNGGVALAVFGSPR